MSHETLKFFCYFLLKYRGFPGGSVVKNLPGMQKMQERWVWTLDREGPLEEGMATHSSILAWRIAWTEKPGGLQSTGFQRVGHDWSDWPRMRSLKPNCFNVVLLSVVTVLWTSHVYVYPLPLELLPHPPSQPTRSSQSTKLSFLC